MITVSGVAKVLTRGTKAKNKVTVKVTIENNSEKDLKFQFVDSLVNVKKLKFKNEILHPKKEEEILTSDNEEYWSAEIPQGESMNVTLILHHKKETGGYDLSEKGEYSLIIDEKLVTEDGEIVILDVNPITFKLK
eukprot:gene6205-10211_t